MKRSCVNCGVKNTCLKRSTELFSFYVMTGHMDELTENARANFSCASNCVLWRPIEEGGTENGSTIS